MARHNRKCICCNTEYSYCPTCSGPDKFKPYWYAEFCSETCKDLWNTATKFNMDMIDKAEAKSIISTLKLKDRSEYVPCVQRDLVNILGADTAKKRANKQATKSHEVVETK